MKKPVICWPRGSGGNWLGNLIWRLEIGWYPGILFGVRTYKEEGYSIHVLYLPFFENVIKSVIKKLKNCLNLINKYIIKCQIFFI